MIIQTKNGKQHTKYRSVQNIITNNLLEIYLFIRWTALRSITELPISLVNVDWTEIRYVFFDGQLIILIKRDATTSKYLDVWTTHTNTAIIHQRAKTSYFSFFCLVNWWTLSASTISRTFSYTGQNNLLKNERRKKKMIENKKTEDTALLLNENKQDGEWYDIGYAADTIIIASRSLAKSFYYDDARRSILMHRPMRACIHQKPIDSIGTLNDQWNSETFINYCYW